MFDHFIILFDLGLYFSNAHFVTFVLLCSSFIQLFIDLKLVLYLQVVYFELIIFPHYFLGLLLSYPVPNLLLQFHAVFFLLVVLILDLVNVLLQILDLFSEILDLLLFGHNILDELIVFLEEGSVLGL